MALFNTVVVCDKWEYYGAPDALPNVCQRLIKSLESKPNVEIRILPPHDT